jgi:NAD-dependent DNA ligase
MKNIKGIVSQLENGELQKCSALTDLTKLKKVLIEADKRYYSEGKNSKPLMNDSTYDMLKDYVEAKDPEFVKNKVGHAAKVRVTGKKTKLPRWMGSMDKKKKLDNPVQNVVLSDKLDGVSCMLHLLNNKMILYTRGNGKVGQNISHLSPYINFLNVKYDHSSELMVRGELIIQKDVFEKIQEDESNARNTVSGFVNSKTIPQKLKNKIDFVAYEMVVPENISPFEQFKYLKKHTSLKIVTHQREDTLNQEEVSRYLKKRKLNSEYEMDGIIVAKDIEYTPPTSGNPKHAFAYKENSVENRVNTTVTKIKWKVSKDGYLKPTVFFKKIVINNVNIIKATGHNAKFVVDNKIGKGSVIAVERSGDVIPKIVKTIQGAEPDMPKDVKYKWNDTKIDILIDDDSNSAINKKQFEYLVDKLGFDHMGKGTIVKLYDDLGIRTIAQLYDTPAEKLETMKGFAKDSALKLYNSIQSRRKTLTEVDYMIASNAFGRGFGEKTLVLITKAYPINTTPTVDQLLAVDGIAKKRAEQYVEGLNVFRGFVSQNKLTFNDKPVESDSKKEPVVTEGKYKNMVFLFTGFRDKALEEKITSQAGKMESSFKKSVTHLVIKDSSVNNSKVTKAKESGVTVITKDDV